MPKLGRYRIEGMDVPGRAVLDGDAGPRQLAASAGGCLGCLLLGAEERLLAATLRCGRPLSVSVMVARARGRGRSIAALFPIWRLVRATNDLRIESTC